MYKYNKGIIPKALTELFTLNSSIHSYNTRNKDKIRSAYGNPCIRILDLPFKYLELYCQQLLSIPLSLILKTNQFLHDVRIL